MRPPDNLEVFAFDKLPGGPPGCFPAEPVMTDAAPSHPRVAPLDPNLVAYDPVAQQFPYDSATPQLDRVPSNYQPEGEPPVAEYTPTVSLLACWQGGTQAQDAVLEPARLSVIEVRNTARFFSQRNLHA